MPAHSFSISLTQSRQFAELSGDWNPVHIDPLVGRRTLFGGTVVHGMHATLFSIEKHLETERQQRSIATIQVSYSTGLRQDERASLDSETDGTQACVLRILAGNQLIQTVKLTWADKPVDEAPQPGNECPPRQTPELVDPAAVADVMGEVPALLDLPLASKLFPSLTRCLPPNQIAAMLATTRIVGMRCPGLHSILSSMRLSFKPGTNGDIFSYSVRRYSAAANFLTLAVQGCGASGEVNAFFRPAPVKQPGFAELRDQVPKGKFAGRRALVIGGSRGLGEICAKLLAAGSAEVIVTWYRGEQDAAEVVRDISSGGGQADAIHWDCSSPPVDLPPHLSQASPTHIYYFATSRIEVNRTGVFDQQLYDRYIEMYVAGMKRSVEAVQMLWAPCKVRSLFAPSTIFLDEPDATTAEYTRAKAAAEDAAKMIAAQATPQMHVQTPRLPKVLTDQTNSVADTTTQSALNALLHEIV